MPMSRYIATISTSIPFLWAVFCMLSTPVPQAQCVAIDPDEVVLQSHLKRLATQLDTQPQSITNGQVVWIRVHHAGKAAFRREVEPLLDRAYESAPSSSRNPERRSVVLLWEWAPTPKEGIPLTRENVMDGRFAQTNKLWTAQAQACFDFILRTHDGQIDSPDSDDWKSEFYRWINKNRPRVELERSSQESCRLSGLYLVHRELRKAADAEKDFSSFCKEMRLEVSFLMASAIQRDLDLRKQVYLLLKEHPNMHVISAFGAGHDPAFILAGVKNRKILAVKGIEESEWDRIVIDIRNKLLSPGLNQISIKDSLEFNVRGSAIGDGLRKGLTTEQAFKFSERLVAESLEQFGSWTELARSFFFQMRNQ